MKYELVNPSDEIYIDGAYDLPVLGAALALLGEGKYGLKNEQGKIIVPMWGIGGHERWFSAHGTTLTNVLTEFPVQVAEALESLTYARRRTSVNDIGARAMRLAAYLRRERGR